MQTDIIYGYGFPNTSIDENLRKFMEKHMETILKTKGGAKLYAEVMQDSDTFKRSYANINEAVQYLGYSCNSSGVEGTEAIISNVMTLETGIRFTATAADDGCETPASIVFTEDFPWHLNEIEKNLTEEKLFEICEMYAKKLEIQENPDKMRLEYYG